MMYKDCFLLALFLFSCKGKVDMKSEIDHLCAFQVSIPKVEVINQIADDHLSLYTGCGLSLIVYTDSTSCTSCAINKQDLWFPFLEYCKRYKGKLSFYFIYAPSKKDRKGVELALKNINFDYPILLDTLGEFERLNPHLPENKVLHTFLLDENNHVILVGNPLHNKKIEEMFYRIVEEKLGKPQ